MIENQIRTDLMDPRITGLLSKDAKNRPNIHLLHAPELTGSPYIEYQIIADNGDLFEEGELTTGSVSIQVDIFTLGSYIEIRNAVKSVLAEKGYVYPGTGGFQSLYEQETKLYHCVLRFIKEYDLNAY